MPPTPGQSPGSTSRGRHFCENQNSCSHNALGLRIINLLSERMFVLSFKLEKRKLLLTSHADFVVTFKLVFVKMDVCCDKPL